MDSSAAVSRQYRVLAQRIGYGASTLLLLYLTFQLDVLLAAYVEDPERILRMERAYGVFGAALGYVLRSPVGGLFSYGSTLPVAVLAMTLAGASEAIRIAQAAGANPFRRFALLIVTLLILAPWLSAAGWLGQSPTHVEGRYWSFVILAGAVVGVAVLTVLRGAPQGSLRDGGVTLLVIFYVGFLASFGLHIRCSREMPGQQGVWLLLVTILVIKASDIGAYLVGTAIGRHKLIPSVSPGKSVEGTLAGIVCSMGVAVATAATGLVPTFSVGKGGIGFESWWGPALFGLAMSAVGLFGDLVESCFKRDAQKKDSAQIIPRFGGILDLIDSPLLGVPVAWFLLTAVWRVV